MQCYTNNLLPCLCLCLVVVTGFAAAVHLHAGMVMPRQPLAAPGAHHYDRTAARGEGAKPLPIVLWHGMGDTCCNPLSVGGVRDALKKHYGVPVFSISSGTSGVISDWVSGFYGNVNNEIAAVCTQLQRQHELADGFNLVGFSQGGQFSRAVVQRCRHEGINVKALITFGGQHQGVVNLPGCQVPDQDAQARGEVQSGLCASIMRAVGSVVYLPIVRDHVVQAQYFKAPFNMKQYKRCNPFLPDLNIEGKAAVNKQYRANMLALDNFVMARFSEDITVVPRDTAWFSWFNGSRLIPLQEQSLWHEDRLGLKALNSSGRLHFEEVAGGHMQFSMGELVRILDQYMSFEADRSGANHNVGWDMLVTEMSD